MAERDDRDSQDSWDNACAVPVVVEVPVVSVVLDWRREYENRRKCAYELWYNPSLPLENLKIAFPSKPACVFRLRAS